MSIEQIRVGRDNFSYVVYCPNTKLTALVDPSYDATVALDFIEKNGLNLRYIINTHHHSDHSGDNDRVRQKYDIQIIASAMDGGHLESGYDREVNDGEEMNMGELKLRFIHTPGHTHGGLCIIVDNEVILTGDTLFIGDCGRTDTMDGNLALMFQTLNEKIKRLPDHLIVYPGHDYGDKPYDTLGNQKKTNKTLLAETFEEFSKIP